MSNERDERAKLIALLGWLPESEAALDGYAANTGELRRRVIALHGVAAADRCRS